MSSLLNKAETKRHILLIAHEHLNQRLHKYERVSQSAIDYLETKHLLAIKELVDSQRRGITIKP
jgi:predicted RNase H-like nuclease